MSDPSVEPTSFQDFGREPDRSCPRCKGRGWHVFWLWLFIVGGLGTVMIGASMWFFLTRGFAGFQHMHRKSASGVILGIPFGLFLLYQAWAKRWDRCTCNPKPRDLQTHDIE